MTFILLLLGALALHLVVNRVQNALEASRRRREEELFRRLHPGRRGVWR